jgi:tetratricopeptide (TPR) repeat protein
MISARHDQWKAISTQQQQVHQLARKKQRVTEGALGLDSTAAAATLAALTVGQPVQQLLAGVVSVSVPLGNPAVVTALSDSVLCRTSALEDMAATQQLLDDALYLVGELDSWEDGKAMLAWLWLRDGRLDIASDVAGVPPCAGLQEQPLHSGRHLGWRWWVLAQVAWHQGDLKTAEQLLQEGHEQLNQHSLGPQDNSSSSSSGGGSRASCLWPLLLPSVGELSELLQQTRQLLDLRQEGNASFQAKQFSKAADAYSKALALRPSSRFAAVLHSNRAAAYIQQQLLVDALADCGRAVVLDPGYAKAYLRWVYVHVFVACKQMKLAESY